MNSKELQAYIEDLNEQEGFSQGLRYTLIDENIPLVERIYTIAHQIPNFENHYENDRKLWFSLPDDSGNLDWFNLYLNQTEKNKAIFINHKLVADVHYNKNIEKKDISGLLEIILKKVEECLQMVKDGIYHEWLINNIPFAYRSGYIKLSDYWKYVPKDFVRTFGKIDLLDKDKYIETAFSDIDSGWDSMSAGDFFKASNLLYDVLGLKKRFEVKENLSEKEYYILFSDMMGIYSDRTEGLLDLNEDSQEEFEKWLVEPHANHPWEFCMAPQMSLNALKENNKFYLFLHADDNDTDLYFNCVFALLENNYPIQLNTNLARKLQGDYLVGINDCFGHINSHYLFERRKDFHLDEVGHRRLPDDPPKEMLDLITWLPMFGRINE